MRGVIFRRARPQVFFQALSSAAEAAVPEQPVAFHFGEKTRNEHLHELRAYLGLSVFGLSDFRKLVHSLADLPMQPDKAMLLAAHPLETLRRKRIILPALTVIERACAESVTRANRHIYRTLIAPLERHHKRSLDNLLNVARDISITWMVTAAIVLWNTVFLERATQALREKGKLPDAGVLHFCRRWAGSTST